MRLSTAIITAIRAHDGQADKQGKPYILHCLRVMLTVSAGARVVAVLHDVVEDTEYTIDDLCTLGLHEPDATALELVTRPDEQTDRASYAEWIDEIAEAPGEYGRIAREVKIADIEDNLNRLTRSLAGLEKRYVKALRVLTTAQAHDAREVAR